MTTSVNETIITEQYLKDNPKHIFVFGDNLDRVGTGGAAQLRHLPNTYGFVTKKSPTHKLEDYFRPLDYYMIYAIEVRNLKMEAHLNPDKTYLVSKVGAGLANKFKIFELIIEPSIKELCKSVSNIKFLW